MEPLNEYNDVVDDMIRPLFANLYYSPVPLFGLFRDCDFDMKLEVTMNVPMTKIFNCKPHQLIKVDLFQQRAYLAWYYYVLPRIQADLEGKTRAQEEKMY